MPQSKQFQESRNRIKYFEDLNEDVPCNSYKKIRGEDNEYNGVTVIIWVLVAFVVMAFIGGN